MDSLSWRFKYLHPSLLSFASGANLVGYMYSKEAVLLILSAICMAATVWVVCGNIEDDKNGL